MLQWHLKWDGNFLVILSLGLGPSIYYNCRCKIFFNMPNWYSSVMKFIEVYINLTSYWRQVCLIPSFFLHEMKYYAPGDKVCVSKWMVYSGDGGFFRNLMVISFSYISIRCNMRYWRICIIDYSNLRSCKLIKYQLVLTPSENGRS